MHQHVSFPLVSNTYISILVYKWGGGVRFMYIVFCSEKWQKISSAKNYLELFFFFLVVWPTAQRFPPCSIKGFLIAIALNTRWYSYHLSIIFPWATNIKMSKIQESTGYLIVCICYLAYNINFCFSISQFLAKSCNTRASAAMVHKTAHPTIL